MMNPENPYNGQPQPMTPSPEGYTPAQTNAPQASPVDQFTVIPQTQPAQASDSSSHNPYEFIMNNNPPKQSTFGGGSLVKRILVIVCGLVVLAVIAAIALSLLAPKSNTSELVSLVQEQQEIIRITSDMTQKSTSKNIINFATTAKLSMTSDQQQCMAYLSTKKVTLDQNQLAMKADPSSSKLLKDASSTNTYDTASAKLIKVLLDSYLTHLENVRMDTKSQTAGALLDTSITNSKLLSTQLAAIAE